MVFKKLILPPFQKATTPGVKPGLSSPSTSKFKRLNLGYKFSYAPTPVQKVPVKPAPVALRTAPASAGGGRGTINRGVISQVELAKADTRTKPAPVPLTQFDAVPVDDSTPLTPKIIRALGLSGAHGVNTGVKEGQGMPSAFRAYSAEKELQLIEERLNGIDNPAVSGVVWLNQPHDVLLKMYEAAKAHVALDNKTALDVQRHIASDIAASPGLYATVATGDKEWDVVANFTKDIGTGAVSEGLALGITAITGGAAAPIVAPLFGLWSLSGKYAEAIGAGVTGKRATQTAEFSGVVNWLGEYIQLKAFGVGKGVLGRKVSDEAQDALTTLGKNIALDSMPKVLARAEQLAKAAGSLTAAYAKLTVTGGARAIGTDMIENGAQELIESLGEDLGDYLNGVKVFNKESAWASLGKGIKAGMIGSLLAGGTSVMVGGVNYTMDRRALNNINTAIGQATNSVVAVKAGADRSAAAIESANSPEVNAELKQGIGVLISKNLNAEGFGTALQTQPVAITAVEVNGEKVNNWAKTTALTKLLGGVPPNRGTFTDNETGITTHENSFVFTNIEAAFNLAKDSNQQCILYGDGRGNWWFIDPRNHEILGKASGLNFSPLGDKTRVTLREKKGVGFSFNDTNWEIEAPSSPLLAAAIASKNDVGDVDTGDEQGQPTYYSGPDMATSGTIQQEAPVILGNVTQAPVPGMSGTTAAPTGKIITFVHYSTKPGLETLSADSMGKGRPGAEIANQVAGKNADGTVNMLPGKLPKLAVYGANSRPEVQFIHDYVYSVKVDEGTLYHVKYGDSVPSDTELQSQGWKGLIYESDSPYFNGQARLFGEVPASYLGKIGNQTAIDPRGYTAGQALIGASLKEVDPFTRTRNAANAPVQGMSGTTGPFLSKNILKALPALSEMAPHDIMRWAGLTEEEIAGMSDKVVAGFAKRVETAYNVAKTKYGKNMAQVVSTMLKPYEQWGLEEYAGIREFSASILGEENVDFVVKILSATSAGSLVGSNITLTEKALEIILTEGRLPTVEDGFMEHHIDNMRNVLAGVELPKLGEFAKAILGDENALVIDRWMARFWFNVDNPSDEQRLVAKVLTTQVAKKSGMTAREMQAAIWVYAREAAGKKSEGSYIKYGEMKAHADEIRFLQELLAKRNAVNQQPITDEAGNVNAIAPFATNGAVSPRAAAAALKLDKSGYNLPSSATLFYQTQYGGQQQSGTGPPPIAINITAGGNPVLTNQQGEQVEALPTLLKIKPIRNFASQDKLSLAEERWKDDINVLRNLGYLDGYTYKLLTTIRGSSTVTEYALLHGKALLPDGKKQAFAPGVRLTPFMELGETLKKNGLTEENLNTFSILYAASKGNPVNVDSMPKVNLTKQGKGKLADKLAAVKTNAITELAAYSPEQYALLKGVMDDAHKYLTPIVNAMHAKGMPLGENLDSGAIGVDEWIDAYVSSAEPNSSGIDASSPTQEKHIETVSHKQVTGYLNGIVNTMNRYNQWFEYNEYVKRFSTEMGFTSDKAIKGAPTFFADNGDVKWVDAPDHIKRQITSIVSRAHATWGLLNTDIYNNLMTASRELKLMTPAFAQTNLFRDAALVLTRYGLHPVAMANTILKLIMGKSEKSSGLVGMGTPNELTGNVFSDFQNIDHAVALTHMQRMFQYIHDNVLGVSESLMRNYAYNVENAGGKSEIEQMYALIASSADFTVYGSSETAANIRKAWQFSQASLDVTMSWDLAVKELGTKMASDNMGTKFEGFSGAALLIAGIAAGIAFKAREKERKELQDYVSQNKIPIRIGSKIITIPEGFNQGMMLENTISTIVAGMMSGDSVGEITSGLGQDVYDGIVGMIGRDGDLTLNSIASTLTPTLFEPITRVFLNTQYGGGQIDPMTWGLNWTHYFKSTTNVAKNLARELHDLSGGTVDISPIKMDYLVKSYLARYGTALTKMDSAGVKSAVSGFMAQQFVIPVPEGTKTQAYSDWQDGYAKIADDLAQAKKGNYPMSQLMVNDFQLLSSINKLFPKQTTAQGVFALSLYGLTVLDAYAKHRKEKVQK